MLSSSGLAMVSDEAYEDLIYEGEGHVSPASLPGMAERTISVFTLSKSYSMTGWRAGYVIAPERYQSPVRTAVLYSTNGVSTPTDGDWYLHSTETAEARKVVGLRPGESPTQWTADGKHLYVRSANEPRLGEPAMTTRVHRMDPWTGRRELWKELRPINPLTGGTIGRILFAADGKTCVYTHHRFSSELFLVEGLK